MFVDACARIALPFAEARDRLMTQRPERGRRVTLVGKEVAVDLDGPFDGEGVVSIPVRWEATGALPVFPSFEGELELTKLSDGSAELWLLGRYRTPLGAIGRVLDRAVLHTMAEDGVRHMLERMVSQLEHPAAAA